MAASATVGEGRKSKVEIRTQRQTRRRQVALGRRGTIAVGGGRFLRHRATAIALAPDSVSRSTTVFAAVLMIVSLFSNCVT